MPAKTSAVVSVTKNDGGSAGKMLKTMPTVVPVKSTHDNEGIFPWKYIIALIIDGLVP
jgi:hypothetical protein